MDIMIYVVVGVVGFASVILYDLAQVHGKKGAASVFSSIGYLAIVASIVFLILTVHPRVTPHWLLGAKTALAILFFLLLTYSVAIEIPLALHRRRPTPFHSRAVVATGFYGVVRHPGLIWFALLWVVLVSIYESALVTIIGVVLVLLDLVVVVVEDYVLFPQIFPDYEEYKKSVPFLIPRMRRN